jgi:hypothetical protein
MVSVILYLVSFFITGTAKVACSVAAYSTIAVAILMILGYSLNNVSKIYQTNHLSSWQYFKLVISNSGPFILLLGIIAYSLYLLIVYQSRIIENHTTSEYNTFSTISIILILIDIYIFYNSINSKTFTTTGKLPKLSYSMMYLIGVLNVISVLIMNTILKYFTTDG